MLVINLDAPNLLKRVVTLVTPVTEAQKPVNHEGSQPAEKCNHPTKPAGYTGYIFQDENRCFHNVKNVTTCNQGVVTPNSDDNPEEKQRVTQYVTNVTSVTTVKTHLHLFENATCNFPDPETPGHHWLCPERGWIQTAVEKQPHGFLGQTLTNPTDPDELAALLENERRYQRGACTDFKSGVENVPPPITEQSPPNPLADLPLLPDDRRFIRQRLAALPRQQHDTLLGEYRRIWIETAEAEPDENRRDNRARKAANLFLLRIQS